MELESGVLANLVASFEAAGQYICDLTVHGTEGVLVATSRSSAKTCSPGSSHATQIRPSGAAAIAGSE